MAPDACRDCLIGRNRVRARSSRILRFILSFPFTSSARPARQYVQCSRTHGARRRTLRVQYDDPRADEWPSCCLLVRCRVGHDSRGRHGSRQHAQPGQQSGVVERHNRSALAFDGTNETAIAAAYNPSLNLLGRSFTLSAWIYRRSNSGWQIIVDKPYTNGHSSPYFDWSLHVENSTGRIVAFLGCEGVQRVSNTSSPLNAWTHVAVTYDGSAIRHYLNGALDRTTKATCSSRTRTHVPSASAPTVRPAKCSTGGSMTCASTTGRFRSARFSETCRRPWPRARRQR